MKTVHSKDGPPIAYWHSGSGTPVLLVHGATDDHRLWTSVMSTLRRHCSVYAMDRRGRGQSGDTDGYALEREWPIEGVDQDGGFAAGRPRAADRGPLGDAALILEDDPGAAAASVFFTAGQRVVIQC